MKNIEDGWYKYKGHYIYERPHPKLYGKYEIYKEEEFKGRAMNLNEAKSVINKILYER